jgi:hypothetical protein
LAASPIVSANGGGSGGNGNGSTASGNYIYQQPQNGGSGGGCGRYANVSVVQAISVTTSPGGRGNSGGFTGININRGSGGGGATSAGGGGIGNGAIGLGGSGFSTAVSGNSNTYGTGGNGGNNTAGAGANGANNTGNGGTGASATGAAAGGNGGSGIVIVRYPLGTIFSGYTIDVPRAIFTATPNGLTSDQAATNALALRQGYPGYGDGVYWINCGGVPKQTYCLMDPKWDGGGWMLIMKAAQGSTFNWGSTHWTTTSTLNPTDTTTTVADAKFDVFNSVAVNDVMAVWPASDIGAGNTGGSLSVSDGWVWLVKNWYTTAITPLAGFQIDRDATPADIFSFSGFSTSSPIWSYQSGTRAHVFGSGAHIAGPDTYITRWGFLWNDQAGTTSTQDAFAGIGLNTPSSSGGDFYFWVGTEKKGLNRNIAWLMYGR